MSQIATCEQRVKATLDFASDNIHVSIDTTNARMMKE
jgi:hypothetical protein